MEHSFLELQKYKVINYSFHEIRSKYGHSKEYTDQLIRMLPESLRFIYSEKFDDSDQLYYRFSSPYTGLSDNGMVFGGSQVQKLDNLYLAMHFANKYLSNIHIIQFLNKIGDSKKHLEQLFEFRPFLFMDNFTGIAYEIPGVQGKTIDWKIGTASKDIIIEMKVRHKTALSNFNDIINRKTDKIEMPKTNAESFFLDVENKMNLCKENELQGLWVNSSSSENKKTLTEYFNTQVNHKKIQFIILSEFEKEASLITTNEKDKLFLINNFNLLESTKYLYADIDQ